jgi:type III restriction enzyme
MRRNKFFRFCNLKKIIPNLRSTSEFLKEKIGEIKIIIEHPIEILENEIDFLQILTKIFGKIGDTLSECKYIFEGTKEFGSTSICELIKDKKILIGAKNLKIDLTNEDWYAFENNQGTSEEQAFIEFFKNHADEFKEKYNKIWLVRNERQIKIYSFKEGRSFEPDFLLFLQNKTDGKTEQFQVFIEPKGLYLTEHDEWKNEFLKQIESESKIFLNDQNYKILGLPFYNSENSEEFYRCFENL